MGRLLSYWFVTTLLLFPALIFPQKQFPYSCADDLLTRIQRQADPGYDQKLLESNQLLHSYIAEHFIKQNGEAPKVLDYSTDIYTIPVVVHVIYPSGDAYGTGSNISYTQIQSQLEALNAAFSKSYPAYNGQSHPGYAQNTRIKFCLARIPSPIGNDWAVGPGGVEYGVKRYPDITGAFNTDINFAAASQLLSITHPSPDYFPFQKYLNIWVVKSIGGNSIIGYAPRPIITGFPIDGVVFRSDVFGDNSTGGKFALNYGLTQGKVLAHEVGHYLNLYHIFQDGCAGANGPGSGTDACDLYGDMICDIKPCTTQNINCISTPINTCTANYNTGTINSDMINDYMSYADDDCMNTFTLNQCQRMWSTLGTIRQLLWQPGNLVTTGVLGDNGCVPPNLNAAIATNDPVHCINKAIVFSNPAEGNTASSYSWKFPGGNPAVATTNSVSVLYTVEGNYKAILTVSDGSITRTDTLNFSLSNCTLDSSKRFMTHWYFGDYCSIDFTTGFPIQTTTALDHHTIHTETAIDSVLPGDASTISISDSSGNLLFYSSGVSVWNSQHQKISTTPIFGKTEFSWSTGLCYIPFPGQPSKYFIVGSYPNIDEKPCGVRFVIVDISNNTVSPYQEFNSPLLPKRFSEYLTVVPHCNGTDYWIVVKGYGVDFDNKMYSLQVTSSGININQNPVISGPFTQPAYGGIGYQLKANRQGNKLIQTTASASSTAALYDFNSRTGEVTNEKNIPVTSGYNNIQSGVAFSPNGEYFYLMRSTNFATNGKPYWLFQYRMSDLKFNVYPTSGFYFGSPFQLGPDGQLYIVNLDNYLARLSNPDKWGESIFDDQLINFSESSYTVNNRASLPAFIDAARPEPSHPNFIIKALNCTNYQFDALCFDSYINSWNFGDGSPAETGTSVQHNYAHPGNYSITLTISSSTKKYGSTSKTITVLPFDVSISGPDTVCSATNFPSEYFAPSMTGGVYKWNAIGGKISGPDDNIFADVKWNNASNCKIQLHIERDNCIINSEKNIGIVPVPEITWELKDTICINDSSFLLSATPSGGLFSGTAVNNNIFSAANAGVGTYTINYSYDNGKSCPVTVTKNIRVYDCNEHVLPPPLPIDTTTSSCKQLLNDITIIKNPIINNTISVKSSNNLSRYQLYNIMGQSVRSGVMYNNEVTVMQIPQGVYFLKIFCDSGNEFRTFRIFKL